MRPGFAFHGDRGRFASAVFTSVEIAEKWISNHRLTGRLTLYPVNEGVYYRAIRNNFANLKNPQIPKDALFIQRFTTASQELTIMRMAIGVEICFEYYTTAALLLGYSP